MRGARRDSDRDAAEAGVDVRDAPQSLALHVAGGPAGPEAAGRRRAGDPGRRQDRHGPRPLHLQMGDRRADRAGDAADASVAGAVSRCRADHAGRRLWRRPHPDGRLQPAPRRACSPRSASTRSASSPTRPSSTCTSCRCASICSGGPAACRASSSAASTASRRSSASRSSTSVPTVLEFAFAAAVIGWQFDWVYLVVDRGDGRGSMSGSR